MRIGRWSCANELGNHCLIVGTALTVTTHERPLCVMSRDRFYDIFRGHHLGGHFLPPKTSSGAGELKSRKRCFDSACFEMLERWPQLPSGHAHSGLRWVWPSSAADVRRLTDFLIFRRSTDRSVSNLSSCLWRRRTIKRYTFMQEKRSISNEVRWMWMQVGQARRGLAEPYLQPLGDSWAFGITRIEKHDEKTSTMIIFWDFVGLKPTVLSS